LHEGCTVVSVETKNTPPVHAVTHGDGILTRGKSTGAALPLSRHEPFSWRASVVDIQARRP